MDKETRDKIEKILTDQLHGYPPNSGWARALRSLHRRLKAEGLLQCDE